MLPHTDPNPNLSILDPKFKVRLARSARLDEDAMNEDRSSEVACTALTSLTLMNTPWHGRHKQQSA